MRNFFKGRPAQVIFVRGEKDLEFRPVADALDQVHGAGVDRVALMTF